MTMKLPDIKDFKTPPAPAESGGGDVGHVVGLDYDAWAPAIVDLSMRADRIEAERHRMATRGYRLVEGDVVVVGYKQAEVWVIPRSLWLQRRDERNQLIRRKIASGEMTEFADPSRGTTTRSR